MRTSLLRYWKGRFCFSRWAHPYSPWENLHRWSFMFLVQCVLKLISAAHDWCLVVGANQRVLLCSGLGSRDLVSAATLEHNKYLNNEAMGGYNRLVFLLSCLSHWFEPRIFTLKCVYGFYFLVILYFQTVHHSFRSHSLFFLWPFFYWNVSLLVAMSNVRGLIAFPATLLMTML